MSRARTTLLALASGTGLLVLTGCGTGGTAAEVASLPSAAPSAGTASSLTPAPVTSSRPDPTAVPRPVMPIGMTDRQFADAYNTFHRCLIQNGARGRSAPVIPGKPTLVDVIGPTPAAAAQACLHLAPLPAP